ncbi:nucleoside deaminase [Acidocella aromatica]|uniref:tRNA-specific adenosine deaminase n=1 Tax=Acidocella aromatica TaxID=1303579 RepID=A0A840VC02_9PROT|nr:nucleoside deaminase [Acidocella aromatica]MBB5373164.1 tRNA(Arg) A34 adenosine deaminase TadA [Acidocella aromatica]
MDIALEEARRAAAAGEVPVGAVLTDATGAVLAVAGNRTEAEEDPAAHAEMLVLAQARAARGGKYLADCTLTVTLEPCAMCAGAIAAFRVKRVVFGAYDPKTGAVEHGPRVFFHATTHHKPEVIGGVRDSDCSALLKEFFAGFRSA